MIASSLESSEGFGSGPDDEQIETIETIQIKLTGERSYDMHIEHFDDMLQDNSVQTNWAGLDSMLIDEELLYLEDEEADKIYKELMQRQSRRKNMEENEMILSRRIRELEQLAAAGPSQSEESSSEGRMFASSETIKQYIKNFNHNDKLDFTQRLMNFANIIEKRYLVDGLVMSLQVLAKESSEIKIALLDQFIPLIQLVQEKCTQAEQEKAAREIFRLMDELLYDNKEVVKDRAIQKLLDIRSVVQNEDKEHIMKLTLKLAHDEDELNRVAALKIMNDFAQDMG